MASEIRVDKITSLSGVGTITPSVTGVEIAGITTVTTLKATTGIVTTLTATTGIVTTFEATTGNITTLRAPTGIVTTLTANTLTANSTTKVGTGITLSPDGHTFVAGVSTIGTLSVSGIATVGGVIDSSTGTITASGDMTAGGSLTVNGGGGLTLSTGNVTIPDSIIHNGDTDTKIRFPSSDTITAETSGNERLRITNIGTLLKGHTTASTNIHDAQTTTDREILLQIHGGNSILAAAALIAWNDSHSPFYSSALYLATSGSDTIGTNAVVTSDHTLGSIIFSGDDGDEFVKGAKIEAHVDGTPGDGAMPTRLMFFTNSGSAQPTERLRIHGSGVASFTSGIELGSGVDATDANTLDDYEEGTWTPAVSTGTNTSQSAIYTKIGRLVNISARLETFSNRTSGNTLSIGGLPFAVQDATNMGSSVFYRVANTDDGHIGAMVTGSDKVQFLVSSQGGSESWFYIKHSDLNNNNTQIRFNVWYITTA